MSSPNEMKKICGFVAQEDSLLPLLTVKETLMFSAKFRLRGIAMWVMRRTEGFLVVRGRGFPLELIWFMDPAILLLDEPTSGLDSTSALQYISSFLILSGGSVVHNGSLGVLEERITQLGFKIPTQLNVLEFAMEIMPVLQNSDNQDLLSDSEQSPPPYEPHPEGDEEMHEISRVQQLLSFLLSSTVEALPIYLQERRVIMKESSRGAYRVSSYMIANTIVFVPFLLVVAILFAVPLYWLVLFLSAISPDFISGNSLICTVLGAFFLFSGYFIPKESIPQVLDFHVLHFTLSYPLDTLLTNEYWSAKNECFSWKTDNQGLLTCALTGHDVLKSRGLDKDTRWINVGIMFGFFIFYRVLCWIILARRTSKTTI
ncbi:unnamed protein product [Rhodiola kirilowii]